MNGSTEAVIWCLQKPLRWSDVEENFFCTIRLGQAFELSVVTVPLSALVHPLCVIPNYRSEDNSFMVVLPKRNRSWYVGDKITKVLCVDEYRWRSELRFVKCLIMICKMRHIDLLCDVDGWGMQVSEKYDLEIFSPELPALV